MRTSPLIFLIVFASCVTSSFVPNRPEKLSRGLESFKPAQPEEWMLSNGLRVLYLEDKELPLMSGAIYFPGGSLFEPETLVGLAAATGSLLREGSVQGISPDEFDRKVDALGAKIESDFGAEFGSVKFSSLAQDFPQVFDWFTRVLREPAFDSRRLLIWKKLAAEAILKRKDDPDIMAGMAFRELVYGEGSPYSREATLETVQRINRDAIVQFAAQYVRPNGAILAMAGSVDSKEVRRLISTQLSSWRENPDPLPPLPPIAEVASPGIYILNRDFDQARVVMGHLGPPRFPPDLYEILVFNEILGSGGFGSVLFSEIRTVLGLAYEVNGYLAPGPVQGVFQVDVATRNDQVGNALIKVNEILERTRDESISLEKFDEGQRAVTNSFVFKFTSSQAVVSRQAVLKLLGYPSDYDERFIERIEAVNRSSYREVANRWVHPEQLVQVIVGRVKAEDIAALIGPGVEIAEFDFDTKPRIRRSETISGIALVP